MSELGKSIVLLGCTNRPEMNRFFFPLCEKKPHQEEHDQLLQAHQMIRARADTTLKTLQGHMLIPCS